MKGGDDTIFSIDTKTAENNKRQRMIGRPIIPSGNVKTKLGHAQTKIFIF